MAARTNLASGGGEDGEGKATAVRDVRVWTRQGMGEVLTLVATNFRGSTGC
jgi:hypothetical protein